MPLAALVNITNLAVNDNVINHTNASFDGRRGLNIDWCPK
jgi:hypothetical protein